MHKTTAALLLLLTLSIQAIAQPSLPKAVSGKIERVEHFPSRYVAERTIDIWLPEGYSDSVKYDVLYMQDGQMLYDSAQTWNKQAWNIDDVAAALLSKKSIRAFIVVGIWNSGTGRHPDYFPQKPFAGLTPAEKDTVTTQLQQAGRTKEPFIPRSDNYLKFIVKELRPYINRTYSVYTSREHTFIAGSSMGGLISLYAICEYPRVFGGAACLSTHWPGTFTLTNNPIPDAFIKYLGKKCPNPKNHKLYFDCGNQTLDALYPGIQSRADSIMQRKGYTATNWVTNYFPGEDHSERAWNKRLHIPLRFLFGK